VLTLLLTLPTPGWGRENIMKGSLSLRQEYDSNINLSPNNERSSWYSIISPGLHLTSQGQQDKIEASYNLGLKKNYEADDNSIEHSLMLRVERKISSLWQVSALNRYYLSDDSAYGGMPVAEVDRELSARRERSRFALNTFSTRSDYQYAMGGNLGLSYENRMLDSKDDSRDDFVRHSPALLLSHRLNQQWRIDGGYTYVNGDFDQADDLQTHTGNIRLNHTLSPHTQLYGGYNLSRTTYDGPTSDYLLHVMNGGWMWQFDQQTKLAASLGYATVDRDSGSDSDGFTYSLDFSRQFQRGSIAITGKGGIDEMQFSGGDVGGLSRFRQLGISGTYQLAERLSAKLAFSFRRNEFIDSLSTNVDKIIQASSGLSYTLTSQYQLSVNYQYKELDAVTDNDGYEDHRLALELKGTYDLSKW